MQEHLYVLSPDPRGWRVMLNGEAFGLFPTRSDAFAAAAEAARRSRATGYYAWVKVRQQDPVPLD